MKKHSEREHKKIEYRASHILYTLQMCTLKKLNTHTNEQWG